MPIKVTIKKEHFKECVDFAEEMWACEKKGEWGNGLINTSKDKTRAQRIGCYGEKAFQILFNIQANFKYSKFGCPSDFLLFDKYAVDIKTSSKYPSYEAGLVRAVDNKGNKLRLKNDIYIFCYVKNEDIRKKEIEIIFVGYKFKEDIIKRKIVPAEFGNHLNYKIPFRELEPIETLVEMKQYWDLIT